MDEICFIIQICAKGIKGSYYTFSKQIVITKNGQKDGSDVRGQIESITLYVAKFRYDSDQNGVF